MSAQPEPGTVTGGQPGEVRLPAPGRWRKKPWVVEAMVWTGENADALAEFTGLSAEGWSIVPAGWYAVKRGGQCVTMDPEDFAATYEPADVPADTEPLEDQVRGDQETIGGTAVLVQSMLGAGELSPEATARILGSLRGSGLEIDAPTIAAETSGKLVLPPDEFAAVKAATAILAALDATLPEGARRPVTPELLTALTALWNAYWNKIGTFEGDVPGYSLITYEDVNTLDEAAQAVEALLYPPAPDKDGTEEEAHHG